MTDVAITLNALTRRFRDVEAVRGLSFEIYRGEVFGCLGHNGAGKTTTVRLLNGVLRPSSGSLRVMGLDPVSQGDQVRRRTGVLTEAPSLDERLTAEENLTIYADLYGVPVHRVQARVDDLLATFELSDRAGERVGAFSKGMKQRLALARALVHEPELLFLDEPTAGLDPVAARQVRALVSEFRGRGRTIFLCTHNLDEAQRLCDRLAVLEHGRLLAIGTLEELGQRVAHRHGLEIEVGRETLEETMRLLENVEGVAELARDGDRIQFSGVGRERIPALLAELISRGVRIYRVLPIEPTLEDVYFALHESAQEAVA